MYKIDDFKQNTLVDEMGVDEMGVDEVGVDEMGSRRSGTTPFVLMIIMGNFIICYKLLNAKIWSMFQDIFFYIIAVYHMPLVRAFYYIVHLSK